MAGVWIKRAPVREPHDPLIPEVKYECPVCYETFVDNEVTSYTASCGHKTCRTCFQHIVKTSMACPICRQLLLNERARLCFPDSKMLGLFILNPSFFAVPGSTVLLRVFEPRYLILIKRCIETDTLFGLQAGFKARRGVLIAIRRHRELPEGHIIMEGMAVARYEAFDDHSSPLEEPDTFGLYRMKSKIVCDQEMRVETEEALVLSKRADELLKKRLDELSRYDKEVINRICGTIPSPSTYEFSFWLLGALHSTEPKAHVLFSTSVTERLKYCVRLLEEDQPFECLMEEHGPA
jgi:Ring finger domain